MKKSKKIMSFLLSVILVFSAFAVVPINVGAVEEKDSYKEDFINALLESEGDKWDLRDIGHGSIIKFLDLNFDGKLEFVLQYGGDNGYSLSSTGPTAVFYYDNNKVVQTEKWFATNNDLSAYYNIDNRQYILLQSQKVFYGDEDNWNLYNYTFDFDGTRISSDIYTSMEHRKNKTNKYYDGEVGFAGAPSANLITEEEYNFINKNAKANCINVNMKFNNIYSNDWLNYSVPEKRQALEKSYDGFTYDNPLNFDLYRAKIIDSDYWSSAYTLSSPSNPSKYRYIVEKLRDDKSVLNMEALTRTYLNLSNLDDLKNLSELNKREYYYKLVLADIFVRQNSSSDFNETLINQTLDFANNLDSYIIDNLKNELEDGLKTKLKNNPALKSKIKNTLSNYDLFENEIEIIGDMMDVAEITADFIDELSKYMAIKKMSSETIEILKFAAQNTQNSALKSALIDFASAYSDNLGEIYKRARDKATTEAFILVLQSVIDSVFEKLPGINVAKIIYSGGKCLSNGLTSADATSMLFLQMSATYELEDAIRFASGSIRNTYSQAQTEENAKLLNSSFNMMLNVANYGNNLLIEYCEAMDAAWITKLKTALGYNAGFDDEITAFKNYGKTNIVSLQNNATLIYNKFISDFPETWNAEVERYINKGKFSIITYCDAKQGVTAITNDKSVKKGTSFNVNQLSVSQKEKIKQSLGNNDYVTGYDLSLTYENTDIQLDDSGYIIIRLPIPEGKILDNIVVYRINEDGSKVAYEAQVIDNMIEFKTNHFSIYVAVNAKSIELFGDVNGDTEVNAKDRMMLTRYLAKWTGYESIDTKAADVNNDGEANAKDRMILARHLAKWKGYETLPFDK